VKARRAWCRYIPAIEMEVAMRVYALSVLAVVILAGAGYAGLSRIQESTADAFTTGSARLDWQEQSNFYGFQAPPPKGADKS
jgi:hypothetical protein